MTFAGIAIYFRDTTLGAGLPLLIGAG